MAKLVRTVFVRDPDRHRTVMLASGEEPDDRLAALVTNPDCWEGGVLPDLAEDDDPKDDGDHKPAAKKAATRPARGRKAADEDASGQ